MSNSILDTWARSTTRRMQKGGDLYRCPLTRAEMTAPLKWHEEQLAVCHRYGELADGTIGWVQFPHPAAALTALRETTGEK